MEARSHIQVWSDFVCPYCFLAEKPLAEATLGLDVDIEWKSFELRAEPQATLRPQGEYLQSVWRRSVYPLATRLGVEIRLPDVSPQPYSRLALEGTWFARERGMTAEYVDAVFRAFFQRSLDIGKLDVLQAVAGEIGLPGAELIRALQEKRYAEAHQRALQEARDLAIRVVPTILIGRDRIEGMPEVVPLRHLLEQECAKGRHP